MDEIDILKALGIICTVSGHSGAPFTHFIYLFHIAVFFIASGFFFKESNSENIKAAAKSILRKLKQLWLPFFVWTSIFTLLHNFFIQINVYTDNPEILNWVTGEHIATIAPYSVKEIIINILKGAIFKCSEQIFGAGWFLAILFMVSVCYLAVDYLTKLIFKRHIIWVYLIVSVVFLAMGFYCSIHGIKAFGLEKVFSIYCLYFIGNILGRNKEKYQNWNWKIFLPILIVSFGFLLFLNSYGSISLSNNSYENPLFLLAASLTGWAFLYSLSYFLKHIPVVKQGLICIGKKTLTVLILHFLCMKIVEYIVVIYYGMPYFCVAAFPNLYGNRGLWWLAYTVVGVGVPVFANIFYHFIVDRIPIKKPSKRLS